MTNPVITPTIKRQKPSHNNPKLIADPINDATATQTAMVMSVRTVYCRAIATE